MEPWVDLRLHSACLRVTLGRVPSLTRDEARARAALVAVDGYEVHLALDATAVTGIDVPVDVGYTAS